MAETAALGERRTSVDEIFDYLNEQISTLQLKPGDRISESEIAAKFGVSRQPVRDAFSRLANADLLLIRPQRATEVRRFSMRQIERSRFVRAAIEKEVLRRAAHHCDPEGAARLQELISQQEAVVAEGGYEAFGKLDYEFHRALCDVAGVDYAFDVILAEKAKIDRLCMLGLEKEQRLPVLLDDHKDIAKAVIAQDAEAAVEAGVAHLARLDDTIARIRVSNANYFERA